MHILHSIIFFVLQSNHIAGYLLISINIWNIYVTVASVSALFGKHESGSKDLAGTITRSEIYETDH